MPFPPQWPHVTVFSSESDLLARLAAADLSALRRGMAAENRRRARRAAADWRRVIAGVRRRRAAQRAAAAGQFDPDEAAERDYEEAASGGRSAEAADVAGLREGGPRREQTAGPAAAVAGYG
jgi:hypothetical protein